MNIAADSVESQTYAIAVKLTLTLYYIGSYKQFKNIWQDKYIY